MKERNALILGALIAAASWVGAGSLQPLRRRPAAGNADDRAGHAELCGNPQCRTCYPDRPPSRPAVLAVSAPDSCAGSVRVLRPGSGEWEPLFPAAPAVRLAPARAGLRADEQPAPAARASFFSREDRLLRVDRALVPAEVTP